MLSLRLLSVVVPTRRYHFMKTLVNQHLGNQHIVIVDSDIETTDVEANTLRDEGFQIDVIPTANQFWAFLAEKQPDLVLLEVTLSDDDGFSLAREFRSKSDIPIIMLTKKSGVIDKVVGLEIGADDYMTKPFEMRELIARIRSMLRRSTRLRRGNMREVSPLSIASTTQWYRSAQFGVWYLDFVEFKLKTNGKEVHLTSQELQLLTFLVKNANLVVGREQVAQELKGQPYNPFDRSFDSSIAKIRKKMNKYDQTPSSIQTIRGKGYILTAHVKFR